MPKYVNMTDSFMSGWGKAGGGKSYLSIMCDNYEQAEAIAKAAEDRSEMKHVAVANEPRRGAGSHTSVKHAADLGGPWLKYMSPEQRLILKQHSPVIQSKMEISDVMRDFLEREIRVLIAKMKAGERILGERHWVGHGDLVPVVDGSWLYIPEWENSNAARNLVLD